MTEAAFANALAVDMALGCSTNTTLHVPAIAHEAKVAVRAGNAQRNQRQDAAPGYPQPRGRASVGRSRRSRLSITCRTWTRRAGVPAVMKELAKKGMIDLDRDDRHRRHGGRQRQRGRYSR